MALSYTAVLRVPLTATAGGNFINQFEFTGGGGSEVSVVAVLAQVKASCESLYGGTFSWVITTDATFTYYTISWTGLTSDPALDNATGNPTFIYISGFDLGEQVSTQFLSADLCDAQGNCRPCPPSVNPDDATDCLTCYDKEIEFCDSTFDVEGLEADTEYTIKITDNVSSKTYDYVGTSDQYGIITITTANYPTGVFTPYNSPLTLTILDANGDPVTLTYGYVNYSCIELTTTNTVSVS